MKKYIPSLIAILAAAATAATPMIQQLIATHPKLAAAAALLSWLVAHWGASPNQAPSDSTVANKLSILLIFSMLIPSVAGTTGCSSDQVQASITVASQVATSAAQIIAPANPEAAQLLTAVGKGIADAGQAYQDYETAEASLKDSKGAALRAALSAIQGNLATILADVRVKNPQLVQYISVGVAVVNTTVVLLLNLVNKGSPAPGPIVQSAAAPALPVLPAKNASDLKKAWNNACKANYPQAVLK